MLSLDTVVISNLRWRLIGHRRKLTPEMDNELYSLYRRMVEFNSPCVNPYLDAFINNIQIHKKRYWDVSHYEGLLGDYLKKDEDN